MSKTCRVCNNTKPLIDFNRNPRNKDNLNNMCKNCGKEYSKNYRKNNHNEVLLKEREYDNKNKNKRKIYRLNNSVKKNDYAKAYRNNNKEKVRCSINTAKRQKYLKDPTYRLKENIRRAISSSFKRNGFVKTNRTYEILGCDYETFKTYIESKFEPWMNWGNYGKYNGELNYGWDVDHIIPLCSATCDADILRLNHHINLRPLCSYINRVVKKAKF